MAKLSRVNRAAQLVNFRAPRPSCKGGLDAAGLSTVAEARVELDGWRCQKYGSLNNLQVHHQNYRSRQGNNNLANLVTLCA
jgi:5-methylcytosine-specific restriction endonuclease McrA